MVTKLKSLKVGEFLELAQAGGSIVLQRVAKARKDSGEAGRTQNYERAKVLSRQREQLAGGCSLLWLYFPIRCSIVLIVVFMA